MKIICMFLSIGKVKLIILLDIFFFQCEWIFGFWNPLGKSLYHLNWMTGLLKKYFGASL